MWVRVMRACSAIIEARRIQTVPVNRQCDNTEIFPTLDNKLEKKPRE